jgi:hypothetical protein
MRSTFDTNTVDRNNDPPTRIQSEIARTLFDSSKLFGLGTLE